MDNEQVYLKTLNTPAIVIMHFSADDIEYVTLKLPDGAVLVAQQSEIEPLPEGTEIKSTLGKRMLLTIGRINGVIEDVYVDGNYQVGDDIMLKGEGNTVKVLRVNEQ